jgi:hypothetical protein
MRSSSTATGLSQVRVHVEYPVKYNIKDGLEGVVIVMNGSRYQALFRLLASRSAAR